jgi:hypothetical protein
MNKITDDVSTSFKEKTLNFLSPIIELLFSIFEKKNSDWGELPIEYTPIIAQPQLLKTFYLKAARYYHYVLYQKAVEILDGVYSSYPGNSYQYIFPSHLLADFYQQLLKPFTVIDNRPEFRNLQILGLKSFPTLFDKADENIKMWKNVKQSFEDDLQYLASKVPQIYPLPYDLEHTFKKIDLELAELKAEKDNILLPEKATNTIDGDILCVHGPIIINMTRATFQYKDDQPKTINTNNREFRFFMYLFQNKGKVINYIDLVSYLDLNVASKGMETSQAYDLIRDIKKVFGRKLKALGVEEIEITKIMNSIVAIHTKGYKLADIA